MHETDWTRVVLCFLIGTVCAFVAFESLEQTQYGQRRTLWTGLGGLTLGVGIWSTHFFGMLGWHTAFHPYYDVVLVFVSAMVAVTVSWLSLVLLLPGRLSGVWVPLTAAVSFSLGIAATHLTGMAALHLSPKVTWEMTWVGASMLCATSAAYAGIRLLLVSRERTSGLLRLVGASCLGGAITSMHFVAMNAVNISPATQSFAVRSTVDGHVLARVGLCNVLLFTFGLLVLSYRQSSRWMQIAHDARQENLEALRQAERLASVGKIAASIAHEINNPLEAVVNLLYLMRAGELDEESRDYLRQAEGEIGRIAAITTHTLKFYRQQSAPEQVEVPNLFQSALTLFEPRIRQAGVDVRRSWDPKVGRVLCNAGELRQVLANLVGNALDAMPEGGVLDLLTRRVGSEIQIEVADTGAGISVDARAQIFEPFFTTKGARGTGLGLSISAEIVSRHKGTLTLASSTEQGASGTRFTITRPAQQTELEAPFAVLAGANGSASFPAFHAPVLALSTHHE